MMLWTVEPYERIFPSVAPEKITFCEGNDFIEGILTPAGFSVSRLVSTDLRKYLKSEYSPGHIRKI